MIRVNNKKVIGLLSVRSLQSARGRNFVAIVAIALTALLFTAVLTIGMSTISSVLAGFCARTECFAVDFP